MYPSVTSLLIMAASTLAIRSSFCHQATRHGSVLLRRLPEANGRATGDASRRRSSRFGMDCESELARGPSHISSQADAHCPFQLGKERTAFIDAGSYFPDHRSLFCRSRRISVSRCRERRTRPASCHLRDQRRVRVRLPNRESDCGSRGNDKAIDTESSISFPSPLRSCVEAQLILSQWSRHEMHLSVRAVASA